MTLENNACWRPGILYRIFTGKNNPSTDEDITSSSTRYLSYGAPYHGIKKVIWNGHGYRQSH